VAARTLPGIAADHAIQPDPGEPVKKQMPGGRQPICFTAEARSNKRNEKYRPKEAELFPSRSVRFQMELELA